MYSYQQMQGSAYTVRKGGDLGSHVTVGGIIIFGDQELILDFTYDSGKIVTFSLPRDAFNDLVKRINQEP